MNAFRVTLVAVVFCFVTGCGLTIRPNVDHASIDVGFAGQTNSVQASEIAAVASWVGALVGLPVPATAAGATIVALIGAWAWLRRRKDGEQCNPQ